jgi:hypothetical protein
VKEKIDLKKIQIASTFDEKVSLSTHDREHSMVMDNMIICISRNRVWCFMTQQQPTSMGIGYIKCNSIIEHT